MTFVFDRLQLDENLTGARNIVAAASTANIAVLTTASAGNSLDGYSLIQGDRFLLKDQTTGTENGIYIANANGVAPDRAPDAPTGKEIGGQYTWIRNGTVNGNTAFICTNAEGAGVVGTDALTFVQFDVVADLALNRGGTGTDLSGVTAQRILQVNAGQTALEVTETPRMTSILAPAGDSLVTFINDTTPVNNVRIANADTGLFPIVGSTGEANIGLEFQDSNANEILRLVSNATAVNYIRMANSATATAVTMTAAGDDTDIDLGISAKGTGDVNIVGSRLGLFAGPTGGIDTIGAGALAIGLNNATSINIGDTGVNTTIRGDLTVDGTTTSVNSETVLLADNHLYLNNGYTTTSAQTGGLVVNYLPIAQPTNGTITAVGANQVTVTDETGLSVGDYIQISGATLDANNGIFVVGTLPGAGVITINTSPSDDFVQNVITASAGSGTVTALNLSVIRAGTDGDWEVGKSSTSPMTFTDIQTGVAAITRSFSLVSAQIAVTNTAAQGVAYFAWIDSLYGSATNRQVIFYANVTGNRGLDVDLFDGTTALGGGITIASGQGSPAIYTFAFTDPGVDARLVLRVFKTGGGGGDIPNIFGVQIQLA